MTVRHPILGRIKTEGATGVREVCSPHSGKIVGQVSYADLEQMKFAVGDSLDTFKDLKRVTGHNRSIILGAASELLGERREMLAELITAESGKPITYSRIEVDRAVFTFSAAARLAATVDDDIIPNLLGAPNAMGREVSYRYFPVGVIAAITPFNFPLNLVAHKVAPAIAAGNVVILKPAPQTPLTAFALYDILLESGLPVGVLKVIPCENQVAEALVRDERLGMISFTGSASVGWTLKAMVPKKKVALELGGNGSAIIDEVLDWDALITSLTTAAFHYAGQVCISLQKLYIKRDLYPQLLEMIVRAAKSIVAGDPFLDETIVGPMISEAAAHRINAWIEEAVARGAKKHSGNFMAPNYLSPTVLTDVPDDATISTEEAFAPILIIEPYDEISEAIAKINSGKYGLQSAIYTSDDAVIKLAYEQLEVGGLIINDTTAFRIDTMPYGGIKDSGFGREGVEFAMREMAEIRVLVKR